MKIDWKRIAAATVAVLLILNARFGWLSAADASTVGQSIIDIVQALLGAGLMLAVKPPPAIQIGDGKDDKETSK